ncbi:MAG TPA: DUF2071 domain-containing protein [Phycisphaerales bacterium]|mgnify:CR=1 FL=1|nr:DUF2071 domain-containing protein [Phycisphaerales bacterium]
MSHPTLTARLAHVAVATWAVPPALLTKFLPPTSGPPLELDLYAKKPFLLPDGRPGAAISLVGVQRTHVRIYGTRWPYLRRHNSLALRICVRLVGAPGGAGRTGDAGQRGVVYIREVVSSRPIAWLLRRWYNHPCVCAPIEDEVKQQTLLIGSEYRVLWPDGGMAPGTHVQKHMRLTEQTLRVVGRKPPTRDGDEAAPERWVTERPFVFGMDRAGRPLVHEVIHPGWSEYPAVDTMVRADMASIFGWDFGFLSTQPPVHAVLAAGGEAAMFPATDAAGVRWGVKRKK